MSAKSSLKTAINLLKVLGHRVRTPLSVISNDLSYFSSLIPDPQECQRAIGRCRQISDFFKPAELLSVEEKRLVQLSDVFCEVFEDRFKATSTLESEIQKNNLKHSLIWIDQLFKVVYVEMINKIAFRFNLTFDCKIAQNCGSRSIYEIFSLVSEEESILPILIDAFLDDSNIRVQVKSDDSFELIFE